MDQNPTSYGGRPWPRRLCVRWGPSPVPKRGAEPPPQFLAHFYCGQTAGCIKMPLGMEVGFSQGDFVLDWDPDLPFPKGDGAPPQFSRWHLHGGGPWSRPHCARWGPSSPPPKKGGRAPLFLVHFHCGQTAACIKMPLGTEATLC